MLGLAVLHVAHTRWKSAELFSMVQVLHRHVTAALCRITARAPSSTAVLPGAGRNPSSSLARVSKYLLSLEVMARWAKLALK